MITHLRSSPKWRPDAQLVSLSACQQVSWSAGQLVGWSVGQLVKQLFSQIGRDRRPRTGMANRRENESFEGGL